MTIKQRDYDILDGLKSSGHAFVAASEVADAFRLADEGLVAIWTTGEGFHAWRLTPQGEMRIANVKVNHEAIL
jgi:hypothetical protein